MEKKELLRKLPKIDELLKKEFVKKYEKDVSRNIILDDLRKTIDSLRCKILNGEIYEFSEEYIINSFINFINKDRENYLKTVVNASGIIIHTNLGRSILCKEVIHNVVSITEGYSNLEYDIKEGTRGSRYSNIEEIIRKITGGEAAIVVNNNAAAVMLVLNSLCSNKQAIVSRGQLVEIGGSFRVPDVMRFSGAELIEVGTTNRTHLYDYENSINENTGALLKVHTSNFKIVGFTEDVPTEELVSLGNKKDIPVIEDIGSGTLIDFSKYGFSYEPTVQESLRKGIDVITFSGDKILGGPQAGIIVGKKKYIDKIKKNQLTRALRIDKMTLAALEGTLKLYLDENIAIKKIPTLYMILSSKEIHKKRAQKLKRKLMTKTKDFLFTIGKEYSKVGGGAMPEEKIDTYALKVKSEKYTSDFIESKLRKNKIPIIARVNRDEVIMDLRTILDKDFEVIVDFFEKFEIIN